MKPPLIKASHILQFRVSARVGVGIIIVLGCPIVKLCGCKPTIIIIIGLIEIPCDLLRAFVTGEIVSESVADHVLGEVLTTAVARNELLSFVVHEFILAGEG